MHACRVFGAPLVHISRGEVAPDRTCTGTTGLMGPKCPVSEPQQRHCQMKPAPAGQMAHGHASHMVMRATGHTPSFVAKHLTRAAGYKPHKP